MNPKNERPTELWDLLADRASGGLSEEERNRLDEMLAEHPEWETDDLDRVSSILLLSSLDAKVLKGLDKSSSSDQSSPLGKSSTTSQGASSHADGLDAPSESSGLSPALVERLQAQAKAHFAAAPSSSKDSHKELGQSPTRGDVDRLSAGSLQAENGLPSTENDWAESEQRKGRGKKSGWVDFLGRLAIAASILAAAMLVKPSLPLAGGQPNAGRLAQLVTGAKDAIKLDWTKTEHPAAALATGDVLWSDSLQKGVMRFAGLPVNDPAVSQYQLWIFDANRPSETPVDGGVFDITKGGENLVPIQAKLQVTKAVMFAVTIEKPGGVVVSSRKDLPLLAKAEG